jgi:hypothetical protein
VALKNMTLNASWQKAQAYLEEGRLTVVELMGNLASYYRSFQLGHAQKETVHEPVHA